VQDGAGRSARSAYLVGCDGGTSTVRKRLGIKLEGKGGIRSTRQVFFRSEQLYDRIPIGNGRHYYVADDKGGTFVVQGDRKEFTLNVALPEGADIEQECEPAWDSISTSGFLMFRIGNFIYCWPNAIASAACSSPAMRFIW
jgi:2-polyprenyl-6-methoxyphenol hydroxylase-like FAD-dependent oxidoreductase